MRRPEVGEVWVSRNTELVLIVKDDATTDEAYKLVASKTKELLDHGVKFPHRYQHLTWDRPINYNEQNHFKNGSYNHVRDGLDLIEPLVLGEDDWSDE